MDHSHDVAFARLTESHETLDQLLCLLAIIDVTHEVTHVVHDQDIGSVGIHAFGNEVIALTDIDGTHIEHEEAVFRKLTVDELHHALSEDVLRALRILFGIHPHHLQRLLPDPFDADQPTLLPVSGATGHEDRDKHGLTRLGLTRDDCQVFSRQTGLAVDVEKEILILDVTGRYDTQFVEFQEQGCNQRGLSCLGEFLLFSVITLIFLFSLIVRCAPYMGQSYEKQNINTPYNVRTCRGYNRVFQITIQAKTAFSFSRNSSD